MGEYVYSLRKKTIKTSMLGEVNLYSFLTKPHYDLGDMDRKTKMLVGKAEKTWESTNFPKYAVVGTSEYFNLVPNSNKDFNLYPVYENIKSPIWYDCGVFPGDLIGYFEIYSGKVHGFVSKK